MGQDLVLSPNGSIELANEGEDRMKYLDAKERRYVQRLSAEVAQLAVSEEALEKEEKRLQRKLAESPHGMQLAQIKRKRKLIRAQCSDMVQRMTGVAEAAYEEYMPGATLGQKIASTIADRPAPLKKAAKAPARGGRK